MKKYTCFVISPIGKEGSDIYQEYKDLFDLIIVPALEVFDFDVKRGDHFISENKIDDSIIKNIQDADICICDISQPNPNVYYELGRRDETGKPVLLLKKKGTAQSPVDIATRRYFEYEWEDRYAIREAQNHIREFVAPLVEQGFERRSRVASLAEIADSINRLERKLDKLQSKNSLSSNASSSTISADNSDPLDKHKLALLQKNIPLAEEAMQQLQHRMEHINFLEAIVIPVANLGSAKAGEFLIENAEDYFDNSDISLSRKITYVSYLLTYSYNRRRTKDIFDLINHFCYSVELKITDTPPEEAVLMYIQQARFYENLYNETKEVDWLNECIYAMNKAIPLQPNNYNIYHHLAFSYYTLYTVNFSDTDSLLKAKEHIDKCISIYQKPDKNQLTLACRIYYRSEDPRYSDYLDQIAQIDPIAAQVLAGELK